MTVIRFLIVLMLLAGLTEGCKHHPITGPIEPTDTTGNPIDTTGNPVDTTGNPIDTTGNGGVPCHPDTVYFANQILPLLNTYCAMPGLGCHDAPTDDNDEIVFNNYSNVMSLGEVTPFDPGDSELYEVITDSDPDKRMPPPPHPPLSAQNIQLIYTWIMQGAQNNSCNPGAGGCDTTNITYALDIQPIMASKCQGCHNASVASDGINLSTLQGVKNAQLDNGRLKGAANHTPGYTPMPFNQPKLPSCDVQRINAWINAGMP
ncbi:MAG TPA: c-type cytochrome domain-containing protein [Chitinophagales bacterium]|nr:c-type cytochrome domain-containing protein [Chitinophagales bacterium]